MEQIYTKCPFGEGPTENVEEWNARSLKKKNEPGENSSRLSIDTRRCLAAN